MPRKKKGPFHRLLVFVVCLLISYGVAAIGSLLTMGSINSGWYNMVKPFLSPPNFVFPIAWNILFLLIAFSLFFAWTESKGKEKMMVITLFTINLLFNISWSLMFFFLQSPLAAFIDIILFWASILGMGIILWKISRKASYLLIPYLLWVSFAIVLNYLTLLRL